MTYTAFFKVLMTSVTQKSLVIKLLRATVRSFQSKSRRYPTVVKNREKIIMRVTAAATLDAIIETSTTRARRAPPVVESDDDDERCFLLQLLILRDRSFGDALSRVGRSRRGQEVELISEM